MRDGSERKSSSSSSPAPDCDVGLGLRLQPQPTESYGGGGASFFSSTSNQFAFMGEIYEAADRMFLPRGCHTTSLTASGGMGVCGKALFTNTQWQELERQKMVHKYIMASIPVPPQLLLPTSCTAATSPTPTTTTTPVAAVTGQDLVRYPGNGSDPEPWRCKRTDGKKWRCSRDVAPNQKYCERHAHKSRPRSRKHVETPSHNNNYSVHHHQQRSTPLFPPTMASSTPSSSFDQTRCIEWFMRGGTTTHQEKNVSVLYEHGKQQAAAAAATASFMSLNNNINININTNMNKNNDNNNNNNPYYPKLSSNKTRHFIDAWEKEGIFESPSSSSSSCKKFSPSSSLSLSMSGENNNNNNNNSSSNYNDNINDHEKPQWMMSSSNHVSWLMNESCSSSPPPLPPGGPLGEALCLGGGSINAHHHGYYGNKSNANSSSCSKSSCEDGDRALNFIG